MKLNSCLLIALTGALCGVLTAAETERTDVVVVAATPAGVAAAVAAARSGASVILVEEGQHVGGIVSGGLTNTDIRKHAAVGGLYNEFKRPVREYYVGAYGADSEQVRLCQDGNRFEPKIAERVMRDMLDGEERIRLVERQRAVAARVVGPDTSGHDSAERDATPGKRIDGAPPKDFGPTAKLVAIVTEDLSRGGDRTEFRAPVFINATYEGDLAALAGVPYRVGRESRQTFGEPHAGKIYLHFGDHNPLPGSTGEADAGIQAFCFRFHLTRDKAAAVPVEMPEAYRRDDYLPLLADLAAGKIRRFDQVIQLYSMPNGKFEANSDHAHPDSGVPSQSLDLAEENWGWPEAGPAERARLFDRYWSHNEGLLWLLQQDDAVPQSIRDEARRWGFPSDEFVDHRHRPHQNLCPPGSPHLGRIYPERAGRRPRRRHRAAQAKTRRGRRGRVRIRFARGSPLRGRSSGRARGIFFHRPRAFAVALSHLPAPVRRWAAGAGRRQRQPRRLSNDSHGAGLHGAGRSLRHCRPDRWACRRRGSRNRRRGPAREILRRGGVILYECAPLRPEGLD